jgi:hypothetical protein
VATLLLSSYFYLSLKRALPTRDFQINKIMHFLDTDTTSYDVVFFGSSRVAGHINPAIIDSACGVNSTCVAIDGVTITQLLALLKKYIVRHKSPRLILLGLDINSLDATHLPYNYPEYYQYLDDSVFGPINMSLIPRFANRRWYESYDAFTYYSSKSDYQKFAALAAGLRLNKKFDNLEDDLWHSGLVYYKGFVPIDLHWSEYATNFLQGSEKVMHDKRGSEMLEEFITTAKQYSPKVIIAFTPVYYQTGQRFTGYNEYSAEIKRVTSACNVTYWDFRSDSICYDTANFYEAIHLNKAGSEKFSFMLASDLKNYLQP